MPPQCERRQALSRGDPSSPSSTPSGDYRCLPPSLPSPCPAASRPSPAARSVRPPRSRCAVPRRRLGADQAGRVHRPGRHRRRRRPDGAPHPGRRRQEQPDEAADRRRQQVGRRRRRGLPRRQGRQGRSAQDHHHAVEPVHDAARHRRAVQLEGPDAGRDAGARPVRAVGQRRVAVQDRRGLPRRGSRRAARTSSRWAAPAPSRKTRSSPSRSRRRPARSSPTCPFKGGGDVAVQLVGKHIDSTVNNPIEAVAQWRAGALRPLCVFDDTARCPTRRR